MDYSKPTSSEVEKENQHEVEIKGSTEDSKNIDDYHMEGNNGTVVEQKNNDDTGVAYTDVAISVDDVIRAGGLGARDDISSFLPVAIDSTDFEASLRDARDFEEPQGEMPRPGLGWTESIDENFGPIVATASSGSHELSALPVLQLDMTTRLALH
ncbi:hypothetical protein C4D60_Mb07t06010 [Musa balbisiana]|uniref:Uncharacterized protein n=1 Tax=Musa balbisiana TaxID=52838 RepID=A0A4S8JF63_MUSBA|nr:hypothetical protein C4D60_Mb07t06010 [Musa balbisiana]